MKNRGIVLIALSAVLYGSIGYFGSQLMDRGLSIAYMSFWRFFCSVLLLLPFVIFHKPWQNKPKKAVLHLFFLGGVCYAGATGLYFKASEYIGTGLGMVVFFTYPIIVVLISFFFQKIPLRKLTVLSLVLISVGCSLIAVGDDIIGDIEGIILGLLSGLGYALYMVGSKKVAQQFSPTFATFVICLGNSIVFLLYGLGVEKQFPIPSDFYSWNLFFLFALSCTILPVLFLLKGMQYVSASKASIISVLEPVTTLAVGAFILGEKVLSVEWVGAAIVLSSAVLIQFEKE